MQQECCIRHGTACKHVTLASVYQACIDACHHVASTHATPRCMPTTPSNAKSKNMRTLCEHIKRRACLVYANALGGLPLEHVHVSITMCNKQHCVASEKEENALPNHYAPPVLCFVVCKQTLSARKRNKPPPPSLPPPSTRIPPPPAPPARRSPPPPETHRVTITCTHCCAAAKRPTPRRPSSATADGEKKDKTDSTCISVDVPVAMLHAYASQPTHQRTTVVQCNTPLHTLLTGFVQGKFPHPYQHNHILLHTTVKPRCSSALADWVSFVAVIDSSLSLSPQTISIRDFQPDAVVFESSACVPKWVAVDGSTHTIELACDWMSVGCITRVEASSVDSPSVTFIDFALDDAHTLAQLERLEHHAHNHVQTLLPPERTPMQPQLVCRSCVQSVYDPATGEPLADVSKRLFVEVPYDKNTQTFCCPTAHNVYTKTEVPMEQLFHAKGQYKARAVVRLDDIVHYCEGTRVTYFAMRLTLQRLVIAPYRHRHWSYEHTDAAVLLPRV